MSTPRYSVVLPTWCGAEPLALTMPGMLDVDRDDIEWVVSNNGGDPATRDVIEALDDPRVRLVQPQRFLPAGRHLEFAYLQACGEWQGHLGDDDLLFPGRFDLLDDALRGARATVVRTGYVRYLWHDLDSPDANSLDPAVFGGRVEVHQGVDLARRSLDERVVPGGGAWAVHRSVIEAVRRRRGQFATEQHVEFFAMRAACAAAERVCTVDAPSVVIGRHGGSAGTHVFHPTSARRSRKCYDWSAEDPDPWRHCPFEYKGYVPISLDAALEVLDVFGDEIGDTGVDWPRWSNRAWRELGEMIGRGQMSRRRRLRLMGRHLRHVSMRNHLREVRPLRATWHLLRPPDATEPRSPRFERDDPWGWHGRLRGGDAGFHDIRDVPDWVTSTFPALFALS